MFADLELPGGMWPSVSPGLWYGPGRRSSGDVSKLWNKGKTCRERQHYTFNNILRDNKTALFLEVSCIKNIIMSSWWGGGVPSPTEPVQRDGLSAERHQRSAAGPWKPSRTGTRGADDACGMMIKTHTHTHFRYSKTSITSVKLKGHMDNSRLLLPLDVLKKYTKYILNINIFKK